MIYLISFFLILASALFSGLTLGLMGLDVYELKRKVAHGNKDAKKVYKVRRQGNLLLSTLLLGNVGVNAALSIFLGSIASGLMAGIIATTLIFLFGEIIPQAVISRHALKFGAKTAWIVRGLIFILYPICGPIAWILNKLLGHEVQTIYTRKELLSIISEHEDSKSSDIDRDEERITKGALTFSDKTVSQVMTPKTVTVMIEENEKMNASTIKKLRDSGLSRFPVFKKERDNVTGILFLRDLVGQVPSSKPVKSYSKKSVFFVDLTDSLDQTLNKFLRTKHHLFIVRDEFGVVEGVISIEDILEEIVGREIVDEFDKQVDLRKVAKKKKKARKK